MTGQFRWKGSLAGLRAVVPSDLRTLTLPAQPSNRGSSGVFLAADRTGDQWWVKPVTNAQNPRTAITDSIVGAVGALIGAPVCETVVVRIPDALSGWEFRPGRYLKPGLAHASRNVDSAVELYELTHREADDNPVRHVGVIALYDWCWGNDDQWLYSESDDHRTFSHDHGWYLPGSNGTWTSQSLIQHVHEDRPLNCAISGIRQAEVLRIANRLRVLQAEQLVQALSNIPQEWPVTDDELEHVGWFLHQRAIPVADRLETHLGGT